MECHTKKYPNILMRRVFLPKKERSGVKLETMSIQFLKDINREKRDWVLEIKTTKLKSLK